MGRRFSDPSADNLDRLGDLLSIFRVGVTEVHNGTFDNLLTADPPKVEAIASIRRFFASGLISR
ncbi:MAG: hypothetical protein MPW16_00480 [Candidatus Manganitrophus sp.]|nr:MAG: hypothetical protein MPW16_00480 [Candidatus Manganitrophus sp.]